jgi:hypothetical protein
MKALEGERHKQLTRVTSDYETLKANIENQVSKLETKNNELQKKVDLFRQEMLNYRKFEIIFRKRFHG